MNVFEGRIAADGKNHIIVASRDAGLDIYAPHGISGVVGQKVAVAVRPEKVQVSKGDLGDLRNKLSGTIEEIAYLGNSSTYQVRLDSAKCMRVSQSNQTRSEESALTWDDRVNLGWAGIVVRDEPPTVCLADRGATGPDGEYPGNHNSDRLAAGIFSDTVPCCRKNLFAGGSYCPAALFAAYRMGRWLFDDQSEFRQLSISVQ